MDTFIQRVLLNLNGDDIEKSHIRTEDEVKVESTFGIKSCTESIWTDNELPNQR